MKRFIFGVGILGVMLWAGNLLSADARTVLQGAWEASSCASFQASVKNPFLPDSELKKNGLHDDFWKISRLTLKDQVWLRVDTFCKKDVLSVYIKNKEGTFGFLPDGFAAEIVHVPLLSYPELLWREIDPLELQLSHCEITSTMYGRIPCWKVTVRIPSDDATLMKITGETLERFKKNRDRYLAKRPITYEFYIDKNDLLIYDRRHYTKNGKLIFAMNLGSVDRTPPDKALFKTPSGVKGVFLTDVTFNRRSLTEMIERRQYKEPSHFWEKCSDLFWKASGFLSWALGILGIGLVVLIFGGKVARNMRKY